MFGQKHLIHVPRTVLSVMPLIVRTRKHATVIAKIQTTSMTLPDRLSAAVHTHSSQRRTNTVPPDARGGKRKQYETASA